MAGFHFDVGAAFLPAASLYIAFAKQTGVPLNELRGGFNADPLKALVRDGNLSVPLGTALRQMADLAAWTAENAPLMTAVEVSSTPYHNAGATAVADIAFAIATGIDYLRALTDAGLDVETAARQITFSIGLGCRFYLAIAKIRAARKLWADVIAASGGSARAQKMQLRVSTGRRVLTTRNQSLNILRNTVACYAGAMGVRTSSQPRRSTRRPACRPRAPAGMRAIRITFSPRSAIWRRWSIRAAAPGTSNGTPTSSPSAPGQCSSRSRRRAA